MKKVNFKKLTLTMLDGTEITEPNLHETTANALIRHSSSSPIRAMELARKIYAGEEMEILAEDVALIKDAVTKSPLVNDLGKEAILKALE